jgi:hypothetical protein
MNFPVPQQVSGLLTERMLAFPKGNIHRGVTWSNDSKTESDSTKFILFILD